MSETISFTMNGDQVTVPKGTTVMEAANSHNVKIPHFCWHPGLSVAGVCRFCMVKVEGRPKLEIACNLQATNGMNVSTVDQEVQEAHKWALEFHLVNHPLDCPICDQAGECKLQDFYMEVGRYKSQMTRPKVLKPKALDVGDNLVLDTERCILCDRCVRFEEEITKTGALGIFNRGDRSIIGTFPGKRINHNYQTNLVDICPVGAFTSKDFRFKQRVWFLKHKPAVCPGCSTGCRVDVYAKPDVRRYFRLKPRPSEVNDYWMCDVGRTMYEHLNLENRLRWPMVTTAEGVPNYEKTTFDAALQNLATRLREVAADQVALLVSAQYTNEEYKALFELFVSRLGVRNIFQWRERTEQIDSFDGVLFRGDRNSNTKGLQAALNDIGIDRSIENEFESVMAGQFSTVVALGLEHRDGFPSYEDDLARLASIEFVAVGGVDSLPMKQPGFDVVLPLTGFAEKSGTLINQAGQSALLADPFPSPVEEAYDVTELAQRLGLFLGEAQALSVNQ